MSELIFLQDMAIVMVVSALTMIVFRRLRMPIVLGYILAGLLIGPHTPPYSLVTDIHSIHTLAAMGVIFLLFSIGLEFSLGKLLKVGAVAFIASTFEIVLMVWIGYSLGKLMGWQQMDSLFLGALLSISSTTIIVKILMENKKINEKFAQLILGILIVEDLWAIVIIALLSGIATTGVLTLGAVSFSMAKVFVFITAVLFLGYWLVPRILRYIEQFQNNEMMTIVVLGLCFGVSLVAAKCGFSIALGAFLIGAVMAETKQGHSIVTSMEPIRDMFTAIFFVSIGMLIDPGVLQQYWLPILLITIVTIIGKMFSCSLATFLTGYDSQTSMKVGLGLAQIGEFSFIIAQLGLDTNVTSSFLYPIAVSVSALTTVTTPFLMNNSPAIIKQIKRFAPKPLVTFGHFYPSWRSSIVERATHRRKLVMLVDIKAHIPKFIFYTIGVVAVYLVGAKYRMRFDQFGDSVYWSGVTLASFPFLIGFLYTLDKMIWEGVFLNLIRSKGSTTGESKETEEFVHNTVRFIAAMISGLIFILLASFIIPTMPLTVFVIVLILASGGFFWRSTRHVHEHIEKTVLSVLDQDKKQNNEQTKVTHDQLVDLIRTNYPLSFETQDLLLPFEQCGINKSIKDLDLRSKTGVSIVGIYRDEKTIPNPSASEKLLPGDVVVLIGTHEQVKMGMQFMQQKMKEPPVVTE